MNNPGPGDQDRENGLTPGDVPPHRARSSLPSFLFISFVLFMLTNNRGDEMYVRNQYLQVLDSLNHQMSNYSAWLNGTSLNFTLPTEDNATMPLVDAFMNFGTQLAPEEASYYSNLTGFWHGHLGFHNLTDYSASELSSEPWRHQADAFLAETNMSAVPELLGSWNWTASEKLSLSIGDKILDARNGGRNLSEEIAVIHGKVEFTDPNNSEELRLDFEGVHFVQNGSIYAFAVPSGLHIDLRQIPSLVPESHMNDTAHAIEAEMSIRVAKLKEKIDFGTIDEDAMNQDEPLKTRCPFKLYGQVVPSKVPRYLMQELEDEIDTPTGITTIKAPELNITGVLVSQSCGILYEIKDTSGMKSQQLFRKITTYAGLSTVMYLILLVLLSRQTARSSSAAGLSRVSRYTFLTQSLIDAVSFVGHITLAILADGRPSLSVLAPAGLSCMLFVYEAQFAVLIGQIQAPEDVPPPRPAPPQVASPPAAAPLTENTYPPTAAQTQTPAAPTPQPPAVAPLVPEQSFLRFLWHHIRTDPSARLWTLISLFLIFVLRIVIFLSLPLACVGSLYSFTWLAQIYRSVRRGRSSGLSVEYLVGVTVCRLFFALYFLGCPQNILDVEPRRWIYAVACFMCVQVGVILLQEHLSPTFFLGNRNLNAKTYDYHPPLPLPDPEAPEQTLGDCAICMDAITVEPALRAHRRAKSGDGEGLARRLGAVGARKSYSLAPCHHLFHTACLERWLAIKNICPQCRRPLPPL
ncbi:hypothetical protein B0H21DRAFT_814236 [Amylocystis lapponica]|nr:hypothetical protein B0H21DRAFT_814236 [Amylocystis lapponica]